MTIFRPSIGNSPFRGAFNPPAAIPPEPVAAQPSNATADTGPSPQQPEPSSAIHPPEPAEPAAATDRRADLVCLADIPPRPIDWLWQDMLACGTLAMLSGDPGSGKTWVALAIAAALSRGRVPSTNHTLQPCTVLYASAANGAAELIRPRFAQLDGDPARLILLRGVLTASAQPASLSLRDTPMLEDALHRTQARLLIIDPLHSYLWTLDRHRANDSARAFDSLARLAEKHRCCILLVRHLRKRGRGLTSIELSAAVRTEFIAGSSPDAPTRPALVQVKSNLGCLAPSLGYLIDNTGAFSWTGPSALTPEEVMTDRPIDAGLPKRKRAVEWLRQYLREGERSQYNIEFAAQQDGVCMATLRRAKYDLGVVSSKETFTGAWFWTLPGNESTTDALNP
jgi:hypothetical protein